MSTDALSLIAQHGDTWRYSNTLDEQLFEACDEGDLIKATDALNQGANPNAWQRSTLSAIRPMFICAEKGFVDIAKELFNRDSMVLHDREEFGGATPLQIASENDQYEMCKWLLEQGVSENAADRLGRTALIEAAANGLLNIMELLIEYRADVNHEDRRYFTALSYCLDFVDEGKESQHWECAKCLIENGANPNYVGKHTGNNVLKFAVIKNDMEMVKRLMEEYGFSMTVDPERTAMYHAKRLDL